MSDSNSTLEPSKKKAVADKPAEDGVITCSYCGDTVPSLIGIEPGMRLSLQENAKLASVPEAVCAGCHSILSKMISMGAVLRSQEAAKEQNRLMLWRNRVALVRKAKTHLAAREYGESAIYFEKYLRVLELVYDKKQGDLSPDLFSADSRQQEMTVVASVYWDLMRIYDQSPRYKDRQVAAAEKLAEFIRFTPIYGHVIRKAESMTRSAKSPDVFRNFLKKSNKNRPRCFIATAAFADLAIHVGGNDPTVEILRNYRDEVLRKSPMGRRFIHEYYRYSPAVARLVDHGPESVRIVLRFVLRKVAAKISRKIAKPATRA